MGRGGRILGVQGHENPAPFGPTIFDGVLIPGSELDLLQHKNPFIIGAALLLEDGLFGGPGIGGVDFAGPHLQNLHSFYGGRWGAPLSQLTELRVHVLIALICFLQQLVKQLLATHSRFCNFIISYCAA